MMATDDLPLFAPSPDLRGMVRNTDPVTSVRAAEKAAVKLNALRQRILELMREAGDVGMTDHELRHVPEFERYGYSTVSKRRTELYQAGYLEAIGERDGFTIWAIRGDV